MKPVVVTLIVILLLGVAVQAAAAWTPYTVVLYSNRICRIYWDEGYATGTWRINWNYYNGNANLTYTCNASLTTGSAPDSTLHFAAPGHPECTIKNVAVVSSNGQAKWTCQGKYAGPTAGR